MGHFSLGDSHTHLFTPGKKQQQNTLTILLKSSLVNQWVYWGYLQECGWRVTLRVRDNAKEVVPLKACPSMGGGSGILEPRISLQLITQHEGSSPGWRVFLSGKSADLHFLSSLYCLHVLRGGELVHLIGSRDFLRLLSCLLPESLAVSPRISKVLKTYWVLMNFPPI